MVNHPFGIRLDEGAPTSELTRRVLQKILANKKLQKDAAGNKDSFYDGSNVRPTSPNPLSSGPHGKPVDNREHREKDDIEESTQQHGTRVVEPSKDQMQRNFDNVDAIADSYKRAKGRIRKMLGMKDKKSKNLDEASMWDKVTGKQRRNLEDKLHTQKVFTGDMKGPSNKRLGTRQAAIRGEKPSGYMTGKKVCEDRLDEIMASRDKIDQRHNLSVKLKRKLTHSALKLIAPSGHSGRRHSDLNNRYMSVDSTYQNKPPFGFPMPKGKYLSGKGKITEGMVARVSRMMRKVGQSERIIDKSEKNISRLKAKGKTYGDPEVHKNVGRAMTAMGNPNTTQYLRGKK